MENHHAINGKIHYKWPFSIAFCMFTRPGLHFPPGLRFSYPHSGAGLSIGAGLHLNVIAAAGMPTGHL